jgi:hypothetical protein
MHQLIRIAAAAVALAVAAPAAAQQRASDGRFGLGVGLTDGPLFTGTEIFVPINVTPNLRVEPFFGIDSEDTDINGEFSQRLFGVGVFWVNPLAAQAQLYAGGRLAFVFTDAKDPGPTPDEFERRDSFIGAALGGEYLPHPRIALGAEGTFGRIGVGDQEVRQFGGPTVETDGGSRWVTQGTLFVRVYLF